MYDILLFVHVAAVIIWVGAAFLFFVLMGRLAAAGDHQTMGKLSEQADWASNALFSPAAVVTLLAGIGMGLVADSFDWGAPWVSVGFLGVVVSLGIGHGMIRGAAKQQVAAMEAGDAGQAEALGKKIAMLTAIDLVVLFLAVFAMTTKFSF